MPPKRLAHRVAFGGGLNTALDAKNVPDTDSPDLDNVIFGLDGTIQRRDGWQLVGDSFSGAPIAGEYWSQGRIIIVDDQGRPRLVDVHADTTTIVTGINLNTGQEMSGYSMNGFFYLHNRGDGAVEITTGAVGTLITVGQGNPGAGNPNGTEPTSNVHPKAKYSAVLRDRVFVANTVESGFTHPSRVRFSEPGEPKSWAYNNSIDFAPDDHDHISGLAVVADRLVVFKLHSIYMLAGHTKESFIQVPVSEKSGGCRYPKTIATGDGLVYFVSADGVKTFDGSAVKHISLKIDPIPGTPIAACYTARKYYLTVNDSGTKRIYIYDADTQTWTRYSGVPANRPMGDYRDGEKPRVYATHDSLGRVIRLDTGNTDNGAAINAYYTTGWMDFKSPEIRKRMRRVYVVHGSDQSGQTLLKLYRDWNDVDIKKTVTLEDPSPDDHAVRFSAVGGTMHAVRARLENAAGGKMHIDTLTFSYMPKRFK